MSNNAGDTAHPRLPAKVADQLLDLLSSDDSFRTLFQKSPQAALAQVGYEPAATLTKSASAPAEGEMLFCMTANQLASKEEIAQAREQLQTYLTAQTDHRVVFCFEAGKIESVLRLK